MHFSSRVNSERYQSEPGKKPLVQSFGPDVITCPSMKVRGILGSSLRLASRRPYCSAANWKLAGIVRNNSSGAAAAEAAGAINKSVAKVNATNSRAVNGL